MRQTEKDEFGFDLCSHIEFTTGELHNTGFTKTGPIKKQFVNMVQVSVFSLLETCRGFKDSAPRYEQQQQLCVINSTTSSVKHRYITLYLFVSHKRLTC